MRIRAAIAAAKIFNQKFKRENEVTREKPLELRIRDLGAGKDYHFLAWTEIFESVNNSDKGREGNEGAKRLIVRKLTDKVS